MIKDTSRLAYREIQEEGTSSNQKEVILKAVSTEGSSLKEISHATGIEINAVSGRVNDLKKEGRLETIAKRKCRVTGRLISPVTKVHKNQASWDF
jgi:DNA-binding MarR family transcriptional regulator